VYRSNAQFDPTANTYSLAGEPLFTLGDLHDVKLSALQAAGKEEKSSVEHLRPPTPERSLRIEAIVDPVLDLDGLLAPDQRAQLVVLRNLAGQYSPDQLTLTVHLQNGNSASTMTNALRDLEDVYPGTLRFDHDAPLHQSPGLIRLLSQDGKVIQEWHGVQNAATLGGAVRERLGAPRYAHMQRPVSSEGAK
jgi:hypothetical protein